MLVIGHRRFLPSLEKNQFSVCLLFFLLQVFFRLLYIHFCAANIVLKSETKPRRDGRWESRLINNSFTYLPPPQLLSSPLTPPLLQHLFYPSFQPDVCVLLLFYLLCVIREIYFPFILVHSPPYHGVIFTCICQGAGHSWWILRNLWQEPLQSLFL